MFDTRWGRIMGRIEGLIYGSALAVAIMIQPAMADGSRFDLRGTVWDREAKQCGVSPYLLYAIALKESRRLTGKNTAAPSAFALNNPVYKGRIVSTYKEAQGELKRYLDASRLTDVGIMQVNVRWNGERVAKPEQLLDVETNVRVGAAVLCDAIKRHPGDIELAIGSYHTPNPEMQDKARQYGRHVLTIWKRLILLKE